MISARVGVKAYTRLYNGEQGEESWKGGGKEKTTSS